MSNHLIKIIIGVVLILGIGILVFATKKPIPVSNDAKLTAQNQVENNSIQNTITLSQLSQHNSRSDCWSAINGGVYDLTSWIPNHPGGEQAVLSICGLDGSAKYNDQHDGKSKITKILSGFKIGTLTN